MTCASCNNNMNAARKTIESLREQMTLAYCEQYDLSVRFVATGSAEIAAQLRELDHVIWDLRDRIDYAKDIVDGLRSGPLVSRIPVCSNAGVKACGHK